MLARRTPPHSLFCGMTLKVATQSALLLGVSLLVLGCGTKMNLDEASRTSHFRWFHKNKNPKFAEGLDFLDSNLQSSKVVGSPRARKKHWKLHWDPGRCTAPRGNELEITPHLEVFDRKTAYWMSWLSVQAYRQGTDALTHLGKVGLSHVDLLKEDSTGFQAFVGSTNDFVIVSFAGTSELIDYVTDLTFASRPETIRGIPGNVHIGFLNVLERSWAKLLELVKKHSTDNKPILMTGHSMGGAQAVISAARLAKLGFPVDSIYIYAVPRIGDETYANHIESQFPKRVWRFVNNEDIVPRLPPPPVAAEAFSRVFPGSSQEAIKLVFETLRYKHVGQMLLQDGRGGLSEPRAFDETEDIGYWDMVQQRTQGKNLPQMIFANWRMLFDHIPFASHCQLNPPKASRNRSFTSAIQ
jgi:triacylglycerol lipase